MSTGTLNAACTHPRANHRHGTYACYIRDACRCEPCRTAGTRRAKINTHARHTGIPALIDPTPARAHLQAMRDLGLSWVVIESRTGVHRTGLKALASGTSRHIRPETAKKILAAPLVMAGTETRGLVDPTGTLRRLHALNAIGWPTIWLARRLGYASESMLAHKLDGTPVTVATRDQIAGLYDELWDTPPVARNVREQQSITRIINRARAHGWAPPMAWDDDKIDDPATKPQGVERRSSLNAAEDVLWLLDQGYSSAAVAARLGVTRHAVHKHASRARQVA